VQATLGSVCVLVASKVCKVPIQSMPNFPIGHEKRLMDWT
jgi:hypothetical protein